MSSASALCHLVPTAPLSSLRGRSCLAQVNSKLQTSNPDIYAIGDVAAFPINNYGLNKLMRQEHVANCRQSAKHAVSAIMDPATPDYDYLPFFYSRIFDLGWQVWLHAATCSNRSHTTGASPSSPVMLSLLHCDAIFCGLAVSLVVRCPKFDEVMLVLRSSMGPTRAPAQSSLATPAAKSLAPTL